MKTGLFSFAFALLTTFSFGQTLHKGSVLGLHVNTSTLKDGVTMEAYIQFVKSKIVPVYEKAFTGSKMYIIKSMKGQDSSNIGAIYFFNSNADMQKYFNDDDSMTDSGKAAYAKMGVVLKEMEKYVNTDNAPEKLNDWIVQ